MINFSERVDERIEMLERKREVHNTAMETNAYMSEWESEYPEEARELERLLDLAEEVQYD